MRVLIGIILGVVLTVGGAYLYDSHIAQTPTSTASAQRPMVNWDVVSNNWNHLTARARERCPLVGGPDPPPPLLFFLPQTPPPGGRGWRADPFSSHRHLR